MVAMQPMCCHIVAVRERPCVTSLQRGVVRQFQARSLKFDFGREKQERHPANKTHEPNRPQPQPRNWSRRPAFRGKGHRDQKYARQEQQDSEHQIPFILGQVH